MAAQENAHGVRDRGRNRERDLKVAREQLTPAQQFIEDLKAEAELLDATRDLQLQLTAARYAGVDTTAAQVGEAYELLKGNEALMEANRNWEELRSNMAGGLYDIVSGAESATSAIKGFLDSLNAQILRNITEDWADALTDWLKGAMGGSGSSTRGGWMSSIMKPSASLVAVPAAAGSVLASSPRSMSATSKWRPCAAATTY